MAYTGLRHTKPGYEKVTKMHGFTLKNVLYLNEVKRIAKSCDCDPFADPIICPDIGYLVSDDPVAIDKASLDLINGVKENVFEKVNKVSPLKQIKYGGEIGLGSFSCQLIEL